MSKQNYTVARVVTHNRDNISKFERHIERKNDNYANMNVNTSQSHRNTQFKKCDCTYNDKLNEIVEIKQVSLRGLKADASAFAFLLYIKSSYTNNEMSYMFSKCWYIILEFFNSYLKSVSL